MIKLFLSVLLLVSFSAFADSFEDYKKMQDGGFQGSKNEWTAYKADIQKGFEAYKNIMDKEFAKYKSDILKVWDVAEVSDNYRWVEYLNNYKIKKIVDFEKGTVTVQVVSDGKKPDFTPVVKDLLTEDSATAFGRDPVSVNTDKQLKEQVPGTVSDKVKPLPIMQNLYSDKPMNDNQVNGLAKQLVSGADYSQKPSEKTGGTVYSMTVKLPEDIYKKGAEEVRPHVQTYSKQFQLDPALVMAVIYTESRFNPMAKSYVPAYGLMQIVPQSAGLDATEFMEGEKRILAPSYLYNPENNVKVGTAYFYLLYNKYLKGITDPKSRLYCAIAAYNTGAGNVAYAFNDPNLKNKYNVNTALPAINAMSPDQVYNHLRNNLRYEEARNYIVRVYGKIKDYTE
ncbi:murein transglycosylase domain-containing protein [Seleniivibrio woodruffii]|uniref:Membrane-bound lytic murein transglycosylase C n=1 Tax=Seleniivibrio woodruffii TaxID=1078050 RepID=A0A4R1K936_9BACT|nr:murein transglycosylase domain-containing protein [Seleniivibrio woodruffii]TCK60882.1 membrane-bound lytic murein transglycosylase C [Seleniivibrio woodruffii]TVZ36512.1 membrane-bound lytic murein transglycosylase C [Seleniivibrio woodruffii]